MKINALILFIVCCFFSAASYACESLRQDVLVVYNSNNIESRQLAEYYKNKRCIANDHLVGVATKTLPDVDWYEFLSINSQIILGMLDLLEPSLDKKKVQCNKKNIRDYWCEANTNLLKEKSKIKHLVLMRGMPVRVAGSIIYRKKYDRKKSQYIDFNDKEVGSVDDYLRYSLINNLPERGGKPFYFSNESLQLSDVKKTGLLRFLEPKIDGRINVGRIDGLTYQSAADLVDRALNAEKKGIGGKIYWNNESDKHFKSQQVFNPLQQYNPQYLGYAAIEKNMNNNKSRYLFGLMNELSPQCTGFEKSKMLYFNSYKSSPDECNAIFIYSPNINKMLKPGFSRYAVENTNNMLAWFGYLDGHSMYWPLNLKEKKSDDNGLVFDSVLNIKRYSAKNKQCNYCENTQNPNACIAESKDALKEIDTRCAGVAEGFFGFNFQSYPVAYFSAWPTSWASQSAHSWGGSMGGGFAYYGLPNSWSDESQEHLLYKPKNYNKDECYDFKQNGKKVACSSTSKYIVSIGQRKNIKPLYFIKNKKKLFKVAFRYKYKPPLSKPNHKVSLNVRLAFRNMANNVLYTDGPIIKNYNCDASMLLNAYKISDTNGQWKTAKFEHKHDITTACNRFKGKHKVDDVVYDGLRTEINAGAVIGEIAFDDISVEAEGLKNTDGTKFTLYNSSFDKGFKQSNTGDHAAIFLSRLNGAAFWGSVSHHNSGGRSFIDEQNRKNRGNSLALFIQGLPLGEAAAINETGKGSGVFYGDPLYSPVAVKLNPLSKEDSPYPSMFKNGFIKDEISIYGSARNGNKSTGTLYYCKNRTTDFAACDNWQEISKINSVKNNELLGKFSTKDLRLGNHLIKLNVTTTLPNGHVAEFNDFMVVKKLDALAFKGLSAWQ